MAFRKIIQKNIEHQQKIETTRNYVVLPREQKKSNKTLKREPTKKEENTTKNVFSNRSYFWVLEVDKILIHSIRSEKKNKKHKQTF